jgi:hypothetical protein
MRHEASVDLWFNQLDHPLKPVMQRVRDVLLDADERLLEQVLYGTIQFAYQSGLCSFVQVKDKRRVTLMFNAAGRLQGTFPHLEGKSVKYMYFANARDVDERAQELAAIVDAWIQHKDGAVSKQQRPQ